MGEREARVTVAALVEQRKEAARRAKLITSEKSVDLVHDKA